MSGAPWERAVSKTDKTRPWWVQLFDPGVGACVEHDHRFGEGRVESFAEKRQRVTSRTVGWWRHERRCERWEVETLFCGVHEGVWGCESSWAAYRANALGLPRPVCPGHTRLYVAHPDVPCEVCDAPDRAPCEMRWPYPYRWEMRHIHGYSVGRASKRLGEKARRRATRDALRLAAKEWRAEGDTDVEPPVPIPHPPGWW